MREAPCPFQALIHSPISPFLPCDPGLCSSGIPTFDFKLDRSQSDANQQARLERQRLLSLGKFRKGILQVTDLHGGTGMNGAEPLETRSPQVGAYDSFVLVPVALSFFEAAFSGLVLDVGTQPPYIGCIELLSNGKSRGICS